MQTHIKKTSRSALQALFEGNSPVNSPKKGPVTRELLPFGDVTMKICGPSVDWLGLAEIRHEYYNDVLMTAMASQITSLAIVYSTVYSGADQWKHQSSASLVFVRGIHRWPVNSHHKGPVTRKMFPFDDVIINKYKEYIWIKLCRVWILIHALTSAVA